MTHVDTLVRIEPRSGDDHAHPNAGDEVVLGMMLAIGFFYGVVLTACGMWLLKG